MRCWAVLPLLLLLPACWASKDSFYTADPRGPSPFVSGRYADPAKPLQVARITRLPDGRYRIAEDGKPERISPVTFAALAVPGRKIWIMQLPFDLPQYHAAVYELVEQRADGGLMMSELNCEASQTVVKAAGGQVTSDANFNSGAPSCTFATRAALEKAVTAYVKAHNPLPAGPTVRRIGS